MCSKWIGLPLPELNAKAKFIVLGYVKHLTVKEGFPDVLTIHIVDFIRGTSDQKSFILRLETQGQKAKMDRLPEGTKAVFFLDSIMGEEGKLATSGSIAILPAGAFYSE